MVFWELEPRLKSYEMVILYLNPIWDSFDIALHGSKIKIFQLLSRIMNM